MFCGIRRIVLTLQIYNRFSYMQNYFIFFFNVLFGLRLNLLLILPFYLANICNI